MSSNKKDRAISVLKSTVWVSSASAELIDALAELMTPLETDSGYTFIEEGSPMQNFIIIEDGTLARTKLSVEESSIPSIQSALHGRSKEWIDKNSVLIDVISGRGRIIGLMHSFQEGGVSYATVTSQSSTKVWLVAGDAFRNMLLNHPKLMLEVMALLAKDVRSGSKSLRRLLYTIKTSGSDMVNDDSIRVLCYDATAWVEENYRPAVEDFNKNAEHGFKIIMEYTTERLGVNSATYAAGYDAVCTFVNDSANADVMQTLSRLGVGLIAQRAAGFDRIDTKAARAYNMTVCRVPAYSPYSVAEMAVALLMTVIRKITKASMRVNMANFTLDSGLMGMDIFGKTVGIMGTGKIGQILSKIMLGFGARLICYDVFENDEIKEAGGTYVSKEEIFSSSDILFLMMPLLPATYHTINDDALSKLKKGVVLINTSRGALIDTKALLKGVQSGIIAGVGMDVYENEEEFFFQDWSGRTITDPVLLALLGDHNIVLTAHQAFFTKEAVAKIVATTLENVRDYKLGLTGNNHPNNCIPVLKD